MPSYALIVNGRTHRVAADAAMPLLWVLRDRIGLAGTKYGCGVGACGACTVLENGAAVRSCLVTLGTTAGKRYTTIEGLSADASHPAQRAWIEEDVAQCGFCQPGMIVEAAALLQSTPHPTDRDIDAAFRTHICRCGTYTRMRAAIHRAAGTGGTR